LKTWFAPGSSNTSRPRRAEIEGLRHSGEVRLADASRLLEVDERLLADLIDAGKAVLAALRAAEAVPSET